ncbi:hypothetical protein F2P79_016947 [Pimephales promelas]|nr:hypothetical protein F2P79_016947 [Pimephales promelas]
MRACQRDGERHQCPIDFPANCVIGSSWSLWDRNRESHVEEKGLRRSRASALDRVDCHSSAENDAPVGCSSHRRHGDRVVALSGYLPLVQSSMFNPVRPPHRTASNPRAELILKSSRESQRPPLLLPSSPLARASRAAGGTDCFAAVNGSRGERKRQEKQEDSGGRNENQDRQIHWDLSVSASRHRRVQHSRTNGANRHHEERLYRQRFGELLRFSWSREREDY